MALDSELLDKFERDWNDALAHYEARTTAARLGDTSVAPYNRTTLDPKVAAGMQSELFGPLQAKWGLLTEGRGRAPAAAAPPSERLFQTRDGVFSVNPMTMESRKVIDVPRAATGTTAAPKVSVGDRALLNAYGRSLAESSTLAADPAVSPAMRAREEGRRDSIAAQIAAIEAKYAPRTTNAPAIDPAFEAKFAQRPDQMMRPRPRMHMGQLVEDPFSAVVEEAPVVDSGEGAAVAPETGGVPFTMFGRGGQTTQGIDFSGSGPSVDRSVRLLKLKQKGQ